MRERLLYEGITAEMEEQEKRCLIEFVGVKRGMLSCALRPSPVMNLQCRMQQVYGYRITGIFPISAEHFKGELPPIQDAELMQNFGDFLTQKMYTNNTSNAVIAYHGYLAGYELLAEAANSPEVFRLAG